MIVLRLAQQVSVTQTSKNSSSVSAAFSGRSKELMKLFKDLHPNVREALIQKNANVTVRKASKDSYDLEISFYNHWAQKEETETLATTSDLSTSLRYALLYEEEALKEIAKL